MDHFVNISAAFMVGLIGSMHCVGMCGPIAFALPLNRTSIWHKLSGNFMYNTGRMISYAFLGAMFGLLGFGFSLAGWQQSISIIVGVALLLSILLPKYTWNIKWGFWYRWVNYLKSNLSQLFQRSSFGNLFFIGLLNGLLPCGLVYVAIFGAIAVGSVVDALAYMLAFGLGTVPLMYLTALAGDLFSVSVRNQFRKIVPVMVGIIAVLFILRGLNLNIPYISPPSEVLNPIQTPAKCH